MISYSIGEYTELSPNELVIDQIYILFNKYNSYILNPTIFMITGKYVGHNNDGNPEFNTLSVWLDYPFIKCAYPSIIWSFNIFETYKDKMKKARSRMHNDVFPYDYSLKEELMRVVWHPERLEQLIRQGYSVDEVFDSLGPYVCGIGRNKMLIS